MQWMSEDNWGIPPDAGDVGPSPMRILSLLLPPMILLVLGTFALLSGCQKATEVELAAAAANVPVPTVETPTALQSIIGRWMREDGGYVLEIRGGTRGGTLDVAYFNPNPITVSRAAWLQAGERLQLLVELSGAGYAGSTYVLQLDPASDRLTGEYRQAVQGQTYQIEFVRR
jgi:hypothetical protein